LIRKKFDIIGGTMKRIILDVIISATLLVFSLFLVLNSQTGFQPKDIIEKNIEAVGGEKAIRAVENFSFRAGSSRYFIRSDGAMKVLTGMMDPVVIIATLITREGVRQNVLHDVRLVQGLEKSRLQCLARLAGGLFSLTSFAEDLSYRGIKPFGPERHHLLVTRAFGLTVSFYVDAETFLVKRMILEAYSPDEGHFEYSYEFGPPMDIAGFRMPSVIFSAPVGSQTSVNPEPQILSEVRFNSTMDERFFEKIDINMGEVQTVPGRLKGNVLDVLVLNPIRPPFIVVTNWQSQDIEKFGLQSGDRLILEASGLEIEVTLRIPKDENDAINYSVPDARIMSIDHLRGNLYYIYFNLLDTKEAERLKSGLVALSPLGVRKKSDIPTADEIVVRYLKEMGGVKNLRAWKGMKGSGRFVFPESGAEEIPMTFWFKPPNKQRIEMVVRGQKVIYATGGTTPWYCDPTQGVPVPTPLPEEQAREAKKISLPGLQRKRTPN
jgi:hypothetical protein